MIITTSISELKARLRAFLDIVRQGNEVLVTDRGRLIARLAPLTGGHHEEGRRGLLLRTGQLRGPSAPLPQDFWKRRRPADPTARSLEVLLDEREAGG